MPSLLAKFRGFRTLAVFGLITVWGVLAAFGIVPSAIEAVDANVLADHTEVILNAADNPTNVDAVVGGVQAAFGALAVVMRLLSKTPAGKKTG